MYKIVVCDKILQPSFSFVVFVQVLSNDGLLFLRIADGRGWTPAKSQGDKSNLFLELAGECVDDW